MKVLGFAYYRNSERIKFVEQQTEGKLPLTVRKIFAREVRAAREEFETTAFIEWLEGLRDEILVAIQLDKREST